MISSFLMGKLQWEYHWLGVPALASNESPRGLSLDSLLRSGYQHVGISSFFALSCSSSRILTLPRCARHCCLLFSIGWGMRGVGEREEER